MHMSVKTFVRDNQAGTTDMSNQRLAYPPTPELLLTRPEMRRWTEPLNRLLRPLSISNDRDVESTVRTLQY